MNNAYEINIGIEVHVQLKTKSKIFCASPNGACGEPNTQLCPICAGHPGVLPILNEKVIRYAVMAGLGTNCIINQESVFARKHYFYPDLPKNYQITQNDKPICSEGAISILLEDGTLKKIRLIRIHIEEDAGKNLHSSISNESFVDLNRAGTPLLEIVSYPDISSSFQAKSYLKSLRNIVMYLDICTGNMEEGAFRADTNVSVRKKGESKLGTRCELKNINSFKFIGDAVEYEVKRQIELLERGEKVVQETRSWDVKEHKTVPLRSKEEAADYRYFPDPDLSSIKIDAAIIDAIKKTLPELPEAHFERLIRDYGLTAYEADILINDLPLAAYYQEASKIKQSNLLINWVLREVVGYLKEHKIELPHLKVSPHHLAGLIDLIEKGIISNRTAQELFQDIAQTGAEPSEVVKQKGLEQVGSSDELEAIIIEIVKANPQQVADYKAGKDKLFGFFVGQAMAKTKGKGNPAIINELLKKHLT